MVLATIAALIVANSAFSDFYHDFFKSKFFVTIDFLQFNQEFSLHDVINDFLMAIFFLLVGLELKREVLVGELSSKAKIFMPVIAACGGVIFPALIFCAINFSDSQNWRGFAIPTATDIVFTYVIIKAFGEKISHSAKIFLITLAVVDDLVAIIIIALFYTDNLQLIYFAASLFAVICLAFLNIKKSRSIFLFSLFGALLWFSVLKSGIHPSLAGVVLALFIPFKINELFPLKKLALTLSPIVNFFILPLFAFANAGVKISNFTPDVIFDSIVLGVALGLFLGKQIGVMLFSFIAVKLKICELPKGSNWQEFYCLAILTGIGFTMSLFIGNLAFASDDVIDRVKIGVLAGSLLSALTGSAMLFLCNRKKLGKA